MASFSLHVSNCIAATDQDIDTALAGHQNVLTHDCSRGTGCRHCYHLPILMKLVNEMKGYLLP